MRPQVATLSVAGVHQIGPTDFGEIIYALREKSGVVPSSPRSLRPANLLCLIIFFLDFTPSCSLSDFVHL